MLAALMACLACSSDDQPSSTAGCERAPTLLVERCGSSGCHGGETPYHPPIVAGFETAWRDLPSQSCMGRVILNTQAPDQSYLIDKLGPAPCDGTQAGGAQMPVDPTDYITTIPLSSEDTQCLTEWALQAAGGS